MLVLYDLFDLKFLVPARFLKKVFRGDYFKPYIPCWCKENNPKVDFILNTHCIHMD